MKLGTCASAVYACVCTCNVCAGTGRVQGTMCVFVSTQGGCGCARGCVGASVRRGCACTRPACAGLGASVRARGGQRELGPRFAITGNARS